MTQRIYKISERDMEFPCWLHWRGCKWHWIPSENDDEFSRGKPSRGFWSPDAPNPPDFDPTAPTTPPGAGETEGWPDEPVHLHDDLRGSPLPPASAGTGTPETASILDAVAKERGQWLHDHGAPKDWVVLTINEVRAAQKAWEAQLSTARQEVEAKQKEYNELVNVKCGPSPESEIVIAALRSAVATLTKERDVAIKSRNVMNEWHKEEVAKVVELESRLTAASALKEALEAVLDCIQETRGKNAYDAVASARAALLAWSNKSTNENT